MLGFSIFVGHMVGDYLLQNDWMALNKKKWTLIGWCACVIHCLLYTISVCLFTGWYRWDLVLAVFISHIVFDKTNIVKWWMMFYGSFKRLLSEPFTPHHIWAMITADNTFHFVTLWLIWKFLV